MEWSKSGLVWREEKRIKARDKRSGREEKKEDERWRKKKEKGERRAEEKEVCRIVFWNVAGLEKQGQGILGRIKGMGCDNVEWDVGR